MQPVSDCPKCRGRMSEGFLLDRGDYGSSSVATWQGGEPKKSIWTGVKQDKSEQFDVSTWRCGSCGYLESYARK